MVRTLSAVLPSGEVRAIEVTPEMTGLELKQQIKEGQLTWDELTHKTTAVEIIVEDNSLLANDAKVLDVAVAEEETVFVSVVFKPNVVVCSSKQEAVASSGGVIDSELLLVVEIPSDETQIQEHAFCNCQTLAKLTIPNSVTHIGKSAF